MMNIDPRHLTLVLAVTRHGSFNRAAEALGISQPALSKSIALLERRISAKVFERGPRLDVDACGTSRGASRRKSRASARAHE